jgi:hypothetical protein
MPPPRLTRRRVPASAGTPISNISQEPA